MPFTSPYTTSAPSSSSIRTAIPHRVPGSTGSRVVVVHGMDLAVVVQDTVADHRLMHPVNPSRAHIRNRSSSPTPSSVPVSAHYITAVEKPRSQLTLFSHRERRCKDQRDPRSITMSSPSRGPGHARSTGPTGQPRREIGDYNGSTTSYQCRRVHVVSGEPYIRISLGPAWR